MRDHLSWKIIFLMRKGWPHKRGSTVNPYFSDREQPIFTTKAHVFQIDPNTKKKWLPASSTAINVSYYHDSNRSSYRIISVEDSKVRPPRQSQE